MRGGGSEIHHRLTAPFFKVIPSKEISGMEAQGWVWVQSCVWDSPGARWLPIWDADGSASPSSDIQDRSIIKIYRKEPLYASFPASHITNGDLRVREGQLSQGGCTQWAGTSKEGKRWRRGLGNCLCLWKG